MKSMHHFALLLLAVAIAGCIFERSGAAAERHDAVPQGEVWITPTQVQAMGLLVRPAALEDVDDTIVTSGRVAFDDQRVTHVFSPVSGRIIRVGGQPGQQMHIGDALAVIESPDVGSASSDMRKAEADLIAAQHDVRRKRDLFAIHAVSQADLELAEDNHRRAAAEMARARQRMRLLSHGSVNVVTQTYTVPAPIDGEVVARMANPGVEVTGQYGTGGAVELYTLGGLDPIWVLADVYEMDLPRVHVGTPVTISVIGYPQREFSTRVDWVSGALDAVTRTARVRCTLVNADRALRPEMYATVNLRVDARRALALPRDAIIHLGETPVVFIDRGSSRDGRRRFQRHPVHVDEGIAGRLVQVQSGIEVGTPIVVENGIQLVDLLDIESQR